MTPSNRSATSYDYKNMNTSKQLFTHISSDGELTLSLVEVDVPKPKAHEIVVKMEASPINPSDMWPMLGPARSIC
jgi:NADPH:quinone reductase-like Zn-dependent oxidoreductase